MSKRSILEPISEDATALERGQRLGELAATVGFDWPQAAQALAKVHEEVGELEAELAADEADRDALADELGDIFFALVNVARKLGIDAEAAMERTNAKFVRRFHHIEAEAARRGRALEELSLDEMEALWQQAKPADS